MPARPTTQRPWHSRSNRDGTTFRVSPGARCALNPEDVIHHIENSRKSTQLLRQLQFDYGYMGDGGPLQIACVLVGTDTSSGAIHATMVPDSKKMDMPYVVSATGKWVRDLGYERFCLHGDKEGVLQLLLVKVAKECRPEGQDWQILGQVSLTQTIGATEQLRKQSPQCVDSLEYIWKFSKTKSHLLR